MMGLQHIDRVGRWKCHGYIDSFPKGFPNLGFLSFLAVFEELLTVLAPWDGLVTGKQSKGSTQHTGTHFQSSAGAFFA